MTQRKAAWCSGAIEKAAGMFNENHAQLAGKPASTDALIIAMAVVVGCLAIAEAICSKGYYDAP